MLLLARELRHLYLHHIGFDRDGRVPLLEILGGTFSRGLAFWLQRLTLGEGKRWQFLPEDGRCDCCARGRGHDGGEATSSITS